MQGIVDDSGMHIKQWQRMATSSTSPTWLYITFYVTAIINIFGHKVWSDIMMREYVIQMKS